MVLGNWQRRNQFLVGGGEWARMRLPYEPPEEYDFYVTFMVVTSRPASVTQILTHGGRSFAWRMGDKGNTVAGLELVRGAPATDNPTTFHGKPVITPSVLHKAVVQVRKDHVAAFLDGVELMHYDVNYAELSLPSDWSLQGPGLGIGCSGFAVRFTQIAVHDVSGQGELLRHP